MLRNKYALVLLGLMGKDKSTIEYASMMSKVLGLKKIYFLHVSSSLEIPKEILAKHPDLLPPLDESLVAEMKRDVEKYFGANANEIECDYAVLEGSMLKQVLHYASIKDVDLIVTGNSKTLNKSSILSTQLANKAPCSVLSVPYESPSKINRILAPIDFSEYSDGVLEIGLEIKQMSDAELDCLHVYKVPIGYAKAGRNYEEFSEIMRINATKEFEEFFEKFKDNSEGVLCNYVLNDDATDAVKKMVRDKEVDLLVLGARGRGMAAKFVLGSVTEELLLTSQVPIFAVKEKGENMSVLKALLSTS